MSQLEKARKDWAKLGYGMFVHFGMNTFAEARWGSGNTPASTFAPTNLNTDQWAKLAVDSGMKYAVLTAKHHDGFCLWPSKFTEYSVKNASCQTDVVRAFVDSCRRVGLKVGLYYSLWDLNFKNYEDDDLYFEYMKKQIAELLSEYGEIIELWFDGGWDKDAPNRKWDYEFDIAEKKPQGERWHWQELYNYIHMLQESCLVVHNSSSTHPGEIKYPPVDIRTSEHFNFVYRGKLHTFDKNATFEEYLPLEFCTSLVPGWFFIESEFYSHPSVECIAGWRKTANDAGGNLLLNVGPDKRGLVSEVHQNFLIEANNLYKQGE